MRQNIRQESTFYVNLISSKFLRVKFRSESRVTAESFDFFFNDSLLVEVIN